MYNIGSLLLFIGVYLSIVSVGTCVISYFNKKWWDKELKKMRS